MVVLPFGFTATEFPGYFWDTNGHELYSLKVGGELRKLPMVSIENKWWASYQREDGWRVSHKGKRRWMYKSKLMKLKVTDSVVPCQTWGC